MYEQWCIVFCSLICVISCVCVLQRDTLQAASSFARRNHLPVRLQDQMIAHLSLRYRTDSEGLQQQETLDVLPKAIRSSISHYLFYSLVDQVYLFKGVSNDLLFQLVIDDISSYFNILSYGMDYFSTNIEIRGEEV